MYPLALYVYVPALLYVLAHWAGYHWPVPLWGVDMLHYYPRIYGIVCGLISAIILGVAATRHRLRVAIAARIVGRWLEHNVWTRRGALAGFVLFAYIGRVREHSLGDSQLRFLDIENLYSLFMKESSVRPVLKELQSNSSIHFELLDVLIHFLVLLFGRQFGEVTPQDAYAWLSIAAGLVYFGAVWSLGRLLGKTTLQRITYSVFCATLGSIQLYFGYGESYTLVSALAATYVVLALRTLRGSSVVYPAICWSLCVLLHAVALSLLPSLLYLLWRRADRPGLAWLSNAWWPFVLWPLVFVVTTTLYAFFYPIRMPLWAPDTTVSYALFSLGHAKLLFNAALMVSPFGFFWGIASYFSSRVGKKEDAFLSWAAWGALGLMFYHNAYLGGRDWDLLSFPVLFCTLWGLRALLRCLAACRLHAQSMLWTAVVPIMCLHAGAFIALNTHPERVHMRLQNLMQDSNQSQHYRYFSTGFYYSQREEWSQAEFYHGMARALMYQDSHDLAVAERTRNDFFLGDALFRQRKYEQVVELFNYMFKNEHMGSEEFIRRAALLYTYSAAALAFQHIDSGDYQLARQVVRNALVIVKAMPDISSQGAWVQWQKAFSICEEALKSRGPRKEAQVYIGLAEILSSFDDEAQEGEIAYEKAVDILLEIGDDKSAVAVLARAVKKTDSVKLKARLLDLERHVQ